MDQEKAHAKDVCHPYISEISQKEAQIHQLQDSVKQGCTTESHKSETCQRQLQLVTSERDQMSVKSGALT